tara:strand:- start:3238 stop:4101 length:864 start_codon:yes stop_codon:yes gene_type:complete
MFRFDYKRLEEIALNNKKEFKNAEPFPHLIIDNFLPKEEANLIANDFPQPNQISWHKSGSGANPDGLDFKGVKLQCSLESEFPSNIRILMHEFNSQSFLYFLKKLCGIEYIFGDPYYESCGLHSTGKGGRLMIHADVNRYPYPELADQYLNVIYYVTPNWEQEWGGKLELWDKRLTSCKKAIIPKFNRLVIFETTKYSYHGHPHPLETPDEKRRNSVAAYYYIPAINASRSGYGQVKTVLWQRTNKLDKFFSKAFFKHKLNLLALDLIPPIISRNYIKFRKSLKKLI